jgi:PAS domain-containing protein
MQVFEETLDRIARSGEAVFAIDGADRIILWNKPCEALLGLPARRVLGKPCYEVMCGRDANDNVYCHRNCAVAHQARQKTDDPVNRFSLTVRAGGDGNPKRVSSSLFAIPSYHPALTTVVHVLRAETDAPTAPAGPEPLTPLKTGEGEAVALTAREKEILRCLRRGCPPRRWRRSWRSRRSPSAITSRRSCRSSTCTRSSRRSCSLTVTN